MAATKVQPVACEKRRGKDRYVGEKQNQLRHGTPRRTVTTVAKSSSRPLCVSPAGYGCYVYRNAFFRYEGQWEGGVKQGRGRLSLGDGGYYEGEFSGGEMEGHGYR